MPIWCNQRISLDCTGEAAGSLTPVAPRNSIESWPELDARNLYDSTATQASQAMAPPWACRSQQSILQSPKTQHSQHSLPDVYFHRLPPTICLTTPSILDHPGLVSKPIQSLVSPTVKLPSSGPGQQLFQGAPRPVSYRLLTK